MKLDDSDLWNELLHDLAIEDAEHGESCEADRLWSERMANNLQDQIAAERRAMLPAPATPSGLVMRLAVIEMSREQLLARIKELWNAAAQPLQLAYRDVSHQSDHDLRVLVTALEASARDA